MSATGIRTGQPGIQRSSPACRSRPSVEREHRSSRHASLVVTSATPGDTGGADATQ